jgi:transcriptional regulator with XRE-family HTH domain
MITDNVGFHESLPPEMVKRLELIGSNVRIARKRRELTMKEMSARMCVSRQTLARLERGDPGVSMSVLASAFWVLGFDQQLAEIADPEKDKIGIYLERKRQPERVRKRNKAKKSADF